MKQLECPNCHLKINENDTHCPFCGHDLSKEKVRKKKKAYA